MKEMLSIHAKLEELPYDWSIERTPQIYSQAGLRERLALAAGRFFISTGEKLVRLAAVPTQLNKKTA